MKQQTAVEWLIEEIECRGLVTKELRLVFEQAKEKEKQQMIDTYDKGDKYKLEISGEQHYNETFNK